MHSPGLFSRPFREASQMTSESGWLNDEGELCLRAVMG